MEIQGRDGTCKTGTINVVPTNFEMRYVGVGFIRPGPGLINQAPTDLKVDYVGFDLLNPITTDLGMHDVGVRFIEPDGRPDESSPSL